MWFSAGGKAEHYDSLKWMSVERAHPFFYL